MKKKENNSRWFILSLVVIIADIISKFYIKQILTVGEPQRVLPFLNLRLAYNKGTAFSFLNQGERWEFWFLTSIAVFVSVFVLIWLLKLPKNQNWTGCALGFILGGAIGNLWDRLTTGRVVDFIDFHIKNWHFATFNMADAAITVGACMLILELFFSKRE